MKLVNIILTTALILSSFCLFAQEREESFSVSAQLRARGEYRNGALFPREKGEKPATFVNERVRLILGYQRPNLEFKLSGQHVGVWGQDPQIDKKGSLMLNEAWARINYRNFFFQLGRQAISYDDERILGSLDWNTSGRFHDALRLGYAQESHRVELILSFNQNDEKIKGGGYYAPGGQPYKSMQTAWYHLGNSSTAFNLSLLLMNLGWEVGEDTDPSNCFMQTIGSHMTYMTGKWKLNASLYFQTGKNSNDISVSAYMGSIGATYRFDSRWSLGLGSDYMSGNEHNSSKVKAFNPLYGTHHKFYGTMDYFYASSFAPGINPGLWDNQLNISMKTSKKIDASLVYHNFTCARHAYTRGEKLKKTLGSEVDLQFNWSIMPDVKLMAGYSVMLGEESMDIVKGGNHNRWQDWAWISINITPQLFSTSK